MLLRFWADQWPHGWSLTMPQLLGAGHGCFCGLPRGGGFSRVLYSQAYRTAKRGKFLLLQNAATLGHGFPMVGTGREESLGCRTRDAPTQLRGRRAV